MNQKCIAAFRIILTRECDLFRTFLNAHINIYAPAVSITRLFLAFLFLFHRFVSDYAMEGYNAICQHRLIQAMQKSIYGPETARTYPLSLLEWTANRKKANMVLQVHCFDGELYCHCVSKNASK